jgi:hypothetical protein
MRSGRVATCVHDPAVATDGAPGAAEYEQYRVSDSACRGTPIPLILATAISRQMRWIAHRWGLHRAVPESRLHFAVAY